MVERRRQRLVVPDVVGLHWENAGILLEREGFPVPEIRYTEAYQPEHTVVSQVPLKGQIASADQPVVLNVAKQNLVRFLPAVYQAAESGVDPDFLRRFLWIFQELTDSITQKIDRVHEQFSPLTANEEFLPWLAQWVALTLDADWPDIKKRKMIRSSAELYRRRGTKVAIARLLEIFTDLRPEIVENKWPYNGFWIGVHSSIGIDTVVLPPVNLAHCFIVRFPGTFESMGEENIARVHQIIRAEKPAHTVYFLEFEGDRLPVPPSPDDAVEGEPPNDAGDDLGTAVQAAPPAANKEAVSPPERKTTSAKKQTRAKTGEKKTATGDKPTKQARRRRPRKRVPKTDT